MGLFTLPTLASLGLIFMACHGAGERRTTASEVTEKVPLSTVAVAAPAKPEWVLTSKGAQSGVTFEILEIESLDKASSLAGIERELTSELPQEQWDALPAILQVHVRFVPVRGNTVYLEDTFLLRDKDMAVIVAGASYPSIGSLSQFGPPKLEQRVPFNIAGEKAGDGTLDYCGMGCPEIKMWFLVPDKTVEFALTYRGEIVAHAKKAEGE